MREFAARNSVNTTGFKFQGLLHQGNDPNGVLDLVFVEQDDPIVGHNKIFPGESLAALARAILDRQMILKIALHGICARRVVMTRAL